MTIDKTPIHKVPFTNKGFINSPLSLPINEAVNLEKTIINVSEKTEKILKRDTKDAKTP